MSVTIFRFICRGSWNWWIGGNNKNHTAYQEKKKPPWEQSESLLDLRFRKWAIHSYTIQESKIYLNIFLFFGFIDENYLKENEKEEGFLDQLIVELTSLVLPSKELMRFLFFFNFVATWSAAKLTPPFSIEALSSGLRLSRPCCS